MRIKQFIVNNKFPIASSLLIIAFSALFLILLKTPNKEYAPWIAGGAGIATLYIGLIKYWIDSDAMFKNLFESFNERFQALNDELNSIPEVDNHEGVDLKVIQKYLNLCSEEYYWYTKGRIPPEIWKAWLRGIEDYLMNPCIKSYFREEANHNQAYYGLFNVLKLNSKKNEIKLTTEIVTL